MPEQASTTRPAWTRSSRAASTTTAPKTGTTTKAAAKAPADKAEPVTVTRFKIELEHAGATKSYEKFVVPESYKGTTVGSIYAPLGTARVAILVIGADDTEE